MVCKNCGNENDNNNKFCIYCGSPLNVEVNVASSNDVNGNINNVINQSMPLENGAINNQGNNSFNNNSNINQNSNDNSNNDDVLLKAYVGDKFDNINNSKFSVLTFFFGPLYMLSRKMWFLGFLWFGGVFLAGILFSFILPFLMPIVSLASIGANIYFALNFRKYYFEDANKKIINIKNQNINKTTDELVAICQKKGGVTIIPYIVAGVGLVVFVILFIIIAIIFAGSLFAFSNASNTIKNTLENTIQQNYDDDRYEEDEDDYEDTGKYGDLYYELPDDYKVSYKSDYSITFSSEEYYCNFDIKKEDNLYDKKTAEEYLNSNIFHYDTDNVEKGSISINDNDWNTFHVIGSYGEYNYAYNYNDNIYLAKYTIYSNDSCKNSYEKILNSLKFEK